MLPTLALLTSTLAVPAHSPAIAPPPPTPLQGIHWVFDFGEAQAKNRKITGRNKREKAEKKAKARFEKIRKAIAAKLEKLAAKHGDSFYGRAAHRSHETYVNSYGRELSNERDK